MPKNSGRPTVQRLHALVRGRVQGVSFRYYTVLEATRLGLVGWVRNNPDGSVEMIIEGNSSVLRDFIDFLHVGSPHSNVSEVTATWHEASGSLKEFQVRYT